MSKGLCPEALCLKPCAFCLVLTSFFLLNKPIHMHWEEKILSVHAKFEKNSQCWQVFYLSGNEIWIFFRKIFIFRYHWQVKYLSAIESSNHPLSFYLIFDMCFTCQCMIFFKSCLVLTSFFLLNNQNSHALRRKNLVSACQIRKMIGWEEKILSVKFFATLRRKKLVSVVFRYTEKKKACQCSFSIHWEEKSLSARLYGYSDKLFICQ